MTQEIPIQLAGIGLPYVDHFSDKSSQGWPPMMQQYLTLRAQANSLLAYQMGDFCEFFFDDAVTVPLICNVCLTNRGSGPDGTLIHMCGLPVPHSFPVFGDSCVRAFGRNEDLYAKILGAGFPLAFAVETGVVKGLMQREIIARFEPVLQVSQ